MSRQITAFAFAAIACLVCACPNQQQEPGSKSPTGTIEAPPASSLQHDSVLTESYVDLGLASPADSAGQVSYSRSGVMLLGGDDPSHVMYGIGMLRAGDVVERVLVDVGEGRLDESAVSFRVGISGSEAWRSQDLSAAGRSREIQLGGSEFTASGDATFFLRFDCAAGQGISINDVIVELKLGSGEAVGITALVPRRDIVDHDIRVPMVARDADGRVAESYGGIATLWVTRGEAVLQIPVAFFDGLADASFMLSETGSFDIQFVNELQEPLVTTLETYETALPVYELTVQQPRPSEFSSADFPLMETHCSLAVDSGEVLPAVVTGHPSEYTDEPGNMLSLELPGGIAIDSAGYAINAMQLRRSELDPTQMRELLAGHVFSESGVPSLSSQAVHLRINGVFQGVYIASEVLDNTWLTANGYPEQAEAYVMEGVGGLNPRAGTEYFDGLFSRVRQPGAGMEELRSMLEEIGRVFAEVKEEGRYEEMGELVDRESLLNYFLALSLTSANDNYRRYYALIDNGAEPGEWEMMATNLSMTFGITGLNNPLADGADFQPINDMDMIGSIGENIILRTLLSSPESQELLLDRMLFLMEGELSADRVVGELDRNWSLAKPDMLADPALGMDEAGLEQQLELIRLNVREHWQYLMDQIEDPDAHAGHDH